MQIGVVSEPLSQSFFFAVFILNFTDVIPLIAKIDFHLFFFQKPFAVHRNPCGTDAALRSFGGISFNLFYRIAVTVDINIPVEPPSLLGIFVRFFPEENHVVLAAVYFDTIGQVIPVQPLVVGVHFLWNFVQMRSQSDEFINRLLQAGNPVV